MEHILHLIFTKHISIFCDEATAIKEPRTEVATAFLWFYWGFVLPSYVALYPFCHLYMGEMNTKCR